MRTPQENELLTRTGPETPSGGLLRRYWQPVALSRELDDGAPIPLRIMGEDLVLFRDEVGQLGLLGLFCSHRCADLSYGRIEDGGLRCLYHGWVFDVNGRCLEQPAEPSNSRLKEKVQHTAYPCHETAGVVFAYMGPGEPPLFPNFHFTQAPDDYVYQSKVYLRCNYLQANEGNIDPAHLSFLHRFQRPLSDRRGDYLTAQKSLIADSRPTIEIEHTRFGVRIFTQRRGEEGKIYLRVTNYVFPNLSFFAGNDQRNGEGGYTVHWHVPIDDERHWRFEFYYHALKPLDKEQMKARVRDEVDNNFIPVRGSHNRYLQDREEMKRESFAGMGKLFLCHDIFAVESPGRIHDRSRETLGSTDMAIVAARRMMLKAINRIEDGKAPPLDLRSPNENTFNDIVVLSRMLKSDVDARSHCTRIIERGDFHAFVGS